VPRCLSLSAFPYVDLRHQVRRPPLVENGRVVGIVAQADIALRENETKTGELVEAISEPSEGEPS
jgi:hypothetical protein